MAAHRISISEFGSNAGNSGQAKVELRVTSPHDRILIVFEYRELLSGDCSGMCHFRHRHIELEPFNKSDLDALISALRFWSNTQHSVVLYEQHWKSCATITINQRTATPQVHVNLLNSIVSVLSWCGAHGPSPCRVMCAEREVRYHHIIEERLQERCVDCSDAKKIDSEIL